MVVVKPQEIVMARKAKRVRVRKAMIHRAGDQVSAEVVPSSESGRSMFETDAVLTADNLDRYKPPAGRGMETARVLQELGFKVRHIGTFSISVEASRSLWEKTFNTKVEKRTQPISTTHPEIGEVEYWSHLADTKFESPRTLQGLVERAYPQRPPIIFESSLPPPVGYHHLEVPADVGMVLRADGAHRHGVTGRGVLVAMVDTGFYRHPFYAWHGYHFNATLAPDATNVDQDAVGHGTGEAANIFSCAPDIDFIGIKWGPNPTLAFKAASDLEPGVMTNSWGYHLPGLTTTELPEAAGGRGSGGGQTPRHRRVLLGGERPHRLPGDDLNKKIYGTIEAWRNRPIEGEHPYVYLDGIVLKLSWAGEVRNVAGCDRRERERLSGDSRHLRGGEGR
jgi:hypothetical protein